MKANELMIGDLVTGKKWRENPFKLTRINDNGKYYYGITSDGTQVGPFLLEEIEPIPLTAEILEKNWFEVTRNMSSSGNKDVWSWRVSKDKVFHIIEHHNKRKFPYFWIELGSNSDIKYVHELQHALRLCGIDKTIEL